MLLAYRLAGLSAVEGHYAGLNARAQCEPTRRSWRDITTTTVERPDR